MYTGRLPRVLGAGVVLAATLLTGCPEKQEDNQNPTLILSPSEQELSYKVGDIIRITVLAKDDDGDELTLEYTSKVDNELSTLSSAVWIPSPQMGVFSWTPDSADITKSGPVELVFIAKDGRGGQTDRRVLIDIGAGNGAPRFESSSNELYNDCCDKPITVPVEVRDDDSESVTITMKDAPEGAEYTDQGGSAGIFKGRFTWQPDAEQAKRRVHSATFVADDGENPPEEQKLTIIIPPDKDFGIDISKEENTDSLCVGDSIIEYVQLPASRANITGTGNGGATLVEAKLTPTGAQRYDDLFLVWERNDPLVKADPDEPDEMMMEDSFAIRRRDVPDTGSVEWTIEYELDFDSDEQSFFYQVCAYDQDVEADDPEQIICAPAGAPMFHSMRAYRSANVACIEEAAESFVADNDSFETAISIPVEDWARGFLCPGNKDFMSVTVRPGYKVKPVVVYSPGAEVDIKLYDQDRNDVSTRLDTPACGGITTAELSVPMGGDTTTYYLELNGEDAIYHIQTIELERSAEDACLDDAIEPNEDVADAAELSLDGSVVKHDICPDGMDTDIYQFELQAGQKLDVLMNFPASNFADMTLFSPAEKSEVSKTSTGSAFTFEFQASDEPLSYEARSCGTHYLMVFSPDGSAVGDYNLSATVSEGSCQDTDEFSASCNHDQSNAQLFGWNRPYDLQVCAKGEDWLKHKGQETSILAELTLAETSEASASDVEFEIYNLAGEKLVSGEADDANGRVFLDYTFPDDNMYFFRIASDKNVDYELLVVQ